MLPLTLVLLLAAAGPASIATRPISRMDTAWWQERFEEKQTELRTRRVDLLWLGDSITQNWERAGPQPWQDFVPVWDRFYGDRNAVNLGFRGDSTCHLLWRLEHGELDGIHPKAAILLIGANNFGHVHTDADETYEGITRILDVLHQRQPAMRVLLLGVLPSIRSRWVTDNTRQLNRQLEKLPSSRGSWLHYVDAGGILEQHGDADPGRFLDSYLRPPDPPLHPTASSQAAIATVIEPTVAAMMGDKVHHDTATVK